jgi:hypothetical protein
MGFLKILGLIAVAGCAWWLFSSLRSKRYSAGIAAAAGLGSTLVVFLLSDWVLQSLIGGLSVPAAAGVTIAFTTGFARPLLKQLKSGPRT